MKMFLTIAIVPLFAGFLGAQNSDRVTTTETRTAATNYSGTLMDAGCVTKHTVHKETTTTPDNSTTTKTTTTNEVMDCPVTTTTTSFVLQTPEGRFVHFDDPSNTKIVEVVKSNKDWSREINDRAPIKVQVVGSQNGDVVVVKTIQ